MHSKVEYNGRSRYTIQPIGDQPD